MAPSSRGRVESAREQRRQQRLGRGVVWLTASVVVPIVAAGLQGHRVSDAPVAMAAPIGAASLAAKPGIVLRESPGIVMAAIQLPVNRPAVTKDVKRDPPRGEASRRRATIAYASGKVGADLYQAGFAAGVPPTVLAAMIRAFSYDVDFQREIQEGDSFEVAYDRQVDDDGRAIVPGGALRFAALTLGGKRRTIYRFKGRDGTDDWFDETGASVRRPLLRTPVDGATLTSGFGSRTHPLLGYTTAHRGVDFGASAGAPVQAAGDGVVEMAERYGGYGNYVRIRHDGELATAYAHLARFAAGLSVGARVRQGQVIGYVGATGMATAAHLHYEVLRAGNQVNPLSVRFAAGRRLGGTELAAFDAARAVLDPRVAARGRVTLVARAD